MHMPDATYLLWLDFRELGMGDKELTRFLVDKARLGLNSGASFGKNGDGFMRMNVACTRATIEEAMSRLNQAVAEWRKG